MVASIFKYWGTVVNSLWDGFQGPGCLVFIRPCLGYGLNVVLGI